jgi:hypothetical protein
VSCGDNHEKAFGGLLPARFWVRNGVAYQSALSPHSQSRSNSSEAVRGLASLTALLFQRRAVALIMSNIARRQMTKGAKAFKAEADAGIARHRVAGRKSG